MYSQVWTGLPNFKEVISLEWLEPVVGIDVAKDKSDISVLGPDNVQWGKTLSVQHSYPEFCRLLIYLGEVEKHFGRKPVLVCEATGHYHRILLHFFSHKGFKVAVINPIQSACVKNLNIRKIKTDEIDSLRIAYVYRLKNFSPALSIPHEIDCLKEICHHHAKLVELLTTVKNQTLAILDQFMPGYQGIFYDTFGQASLKVLSHFPSPEDILKAGRQGLMTFLKACPGLSLKSMQTKVEALLSVASESLEMVIPNPAFPQILLSNIKLIFAINEQIRQTKVQINEKAQSIPDYQLLRSIPGLGPTNATQILCEIGSIKRFKNPKQFVAFCGIDPSVKRSGQFNGTRNTMSKRGSPMLRKALYMAALKAICQEKDGSKVNPID
jgi:transposase